MEILIIGIVAISLLGYWYFTYQKKQAILAEEERKRKAEEERIRLEKERILKEKQLAIIESHLPQIEKLNSYSKTFTSYKSGYFNNNRQKAWLSSSTPIFEQINNFPFNNLSLNSTVVVTINTFINFHKNIKSIRSDYNKKFIEHELSENEDFFSNIDNASLDKQQRVAIVKDEDNNLIIAGAGSGKTTTVAGKVAYITNRFKVKPEDILLITFTRKASEEMKERIKSKMDIPIEVNTFHSFGRKVIGEATSKMPTVIDETEYYRLLSSIFNNLMKDASYSTLVLKFLTEYRLEWKEDNDFKSHGEYINYLKENKLESYKKVPVVIQGVTTMLREKCKSREEVLIANYLFLNGINYKYEEPYQHQTADNIYAQYKPDFYLIDYDIYIEHLGFIDKDYNVPKWFSSGNHSSAKDKYKSDYDWKIATHKEYNTTLIETYSYENKEGKLLLNLESKLKQHNIIIKPRTNEEIWKILNDIAKDEVSALDTLISTFLNLFKSNNKSISDLKVSISSNANANIDTRNSIFLSIFEPIITAYNSELSRANKIDFNDMINQATDYIKSKQYKHKFKYVIIDEFQDTSLGRFKLVKSVLDTSAITRLFAVGDDWQSIYRFAGSDISLFTQFANYFGITETSKIETTYRFSSSMIDISSKFILTNPNQTPKELKAFKQSDIQPISIIESPSFRNDDTLPFIQILQEINQYAETSHTIPTIKALGRYKNVIEPYLNDTTNFTVTENSSTGNQIIVYNSLPNLNVEFLTVHRSKGLQADFVIVLNCVSGAYGFPSEQSDDPILNLLLSKADQFPNGEERRLFYVALTRSKIKTYLTTNSQYKSKFIKELEQNVSESTDNFCPLCKQGQKIKSNVVSRDGTPLIKVSCSNWNYDCKYLAWEKR
jgi:DNA helicase-4